MLALLKLGFRYDEILNMTELDAEEYISSYMKLTGSNREKIRTFPVKRK